MEHVGSELQNKKKTANQGKEWYRILSGSGTGASALCTTPSELERATGNAVLANRELSMSDTLIAPVYPERRSLVSDSKEGNGGSSKERSAYTRRHKDRRVSKPWWPSFVS